MISAKVTIHSQEAQLRRKMRNVHRRMLQAGANFLVKTIKQNISVIGPPASVPGEFPHIDSSDLHDNVHANVNARRALVISDMPYSEAIEHMRPFMQRTYKENRKQLFEVMIHSGRRAMGGPT